MSCTLLLGNSRNELSAVADNSVDSIVTDPPSGTNMILPFRRSGDAARYVGFDSPLGKLRYNFKTQHRVNMRLRECFKDDVWPVLSQAARILKPGGYGVFWGMSRTLHWLAWGVEEAGLSILDVFVFVHPARRLKSPYVDGKCTQVVQRTQLWLLARKPGETTASVNETRWGTGYMNILDGSVRVANLFDLKNERHLTEQPTEKSVVQMRTLVRLVTPKNGLVLDPFMGSGTTGVAAAQEGRRFLGVEKDPHWFKVAQRRTQSP